MHSCKEPAIGPGLLSCTHWGCIIARWRYWSWMLACCIFNKSKTNLLEENNAFFIRDNYSHLALCLHVIQPHSYYVQLSSHFNSDARWRRFRNFTSNTQSTTATAATTTTTATTATTITSALQLCPIIASRRLLSFLTNFSYHTGNNSSEFSRLNFWRRTQNSLESESTQPTIFSSQFLTSLQIRFLAQVEANLKTKLNVGGVPHGKMVFIAFSLLTQQH